MTEESQIRSVALFFFFALQSEAAAKLATVNTLRLSQRKVRKEKLNEADIAPTLIHLTHRVWRKACKQKVKPPAAAPSARYETGWLLPEDLDIGPWKQFQKEGEGDEVLAVIWSRILGFSDTDIAQGLGLTVGTVRHRVGRGLRHLGSLQHLRGNYV